MSRFIYKNRRWVPATDGDTCNGCSVRNDPRFIGKLDKWHINRNPNRDDEWFLSGKLRRDYRAGGGRRGLNYTGGLHGAWRFRLNVALREWDTFQLNDYE